MTILIPLIILLYLLGVILFAFYSHHPDIRTTLQNPDAVVAHYAANMLPHGLVGLVVASIFAGSMSTVSASINSLATSSVVDLYQRLLQTDRSDAHYTFASRFATLLWGFVATVGAFYANRLGPLILAFTKIQSLLGGVILGIFVLGIISKRATSTGAIVGSLVGFFSVIYVSVYTAVSLYWYCVIGCICTLLIGQLHSQVISTTRQA